MLHSRRQVWHSNVHSKNCKHPEVPYNYSTEPPYLIHPPPPPQMRMQPVYPNYSARPRTLSMPTTAPPFPPMSILPFFPPHSQYYPPNSNSILATPPPPPPPATACPVPPSNLPIHQQRTLISPNHLPAPTGSASVPVTPEAAAVNGGVSPLHCKNPSRSLPTSPPTSPSHQRTHSRDRTNSLNLSAQNSSSSGGSTINCEKRSFINFDNWNGKLFQSASETPPSNFEGASQPVKKGSAEEAEMFDDDVFNYGMLKKSIMDLWKDDESDNTSLQQNGLTENEGRLLNSFENKGMEELENRENKTHGKKEGSRRSKRSLSGRIVHNVSEIGSRRVSSEDENIKLFIAHIPDTCSKGEIYKLFERYGSIVNLRIIKGSTSTGASSCYAFLVYSSKVEADSAIANLHNKITLAPHPQPLLVKYASDESDPTGIKLFVGNLLKDCNEKHLTETFSPFGEIREIIFIPTTKNTGVNSSSRCAFIKYKDQEAANAAVNALHEKKRVYGPNGASRLLVVRRADTISEKIQRGRSHSLSGPKGCNLFVHHIPLEWTDKDLSLLFSPFGRIISAKIIPNRCFGFVSFASQAAASAAIMELNGKEFGEKRLLVKHK
eukprot:GCRY01002983.1.p1 GENE.GCRY01002983.1~~GCRY01002983.1.p1  ORF type:complete len:606 (-),score=91.75 GCRY01002983.1:607-2424(-)